MLCVRLLWHFPATNLWVIIFISARYKFIYLSQIALNFLSWALTILNFSSYTLFIGLRDRMLNFCCRLYLWRWASQIFVAIVEVVIFCNFISIFDLYFLIFFKSKLFLLFLCYHFWLNFSINLCSCLSKIDFSRCISFLAQSKLSLVILLENISSINSHILPRFTDSF